MDEFVFCKWLLSRLKKPVRWDTGKTFCCSAVSGGVALVYGSWIVNWLRFWMCGDWYWEKLFVVVHLVGVIVLVCECWFDVWYVRNIFFCFLLFLGSSYFFAFLYTLGFCRKYFLCFLNVFCSTLFFPFFNLLLPFYFFVLHFFILGWLFVLVWGDWY